MSYRYEFLANATDGRIELPAEIASRLRLKGVTRLHVVVTTVAEEEARLAGRGIDSDMIDRIAVTQRFDRDVATVVLGSEGSIEPGSPLADRLAALCPAPEGT